MLYNINTWILKNTNEKIQVFLKLDLNAKPVARAKKKLKLNQTVKNCNELKNTNSPHRLTQTIQYEDQSYIIKFVSFKYIKLLFQN